MQPEATKTKLLSRAAASPSQPRFARQLSQRESPWQSTQALLFLPKLFPLSSCRFAKHRQREGPVKTEKGTATRFCAAAPWSKMFWNALCVRFGHYPWKNHCYKSKVGQPAGCPTLHFHEKSRASPAVRSQYRSTPSLVTRAYTSGASSGFSAPYTRPLRYSAAAASNLSAAP